MKNQLTIDEFLRGIDLLRKEELRLIPTTFLWPESLYNDFIEACKKDDLETIIELLECSLIEY